MKDNGYIPAQLPLTHVIMQLEGGRDNWTQSEVEQALMSINKPLRLITIQDIHVVIEVLRHVEAGMCEEKPETKKE